MSRGQRIKVAILGGGCGSMAAAFELTRTPELRARYDVTVYQQGWRLGGKGANGREAACAQRIQEHGLHAFLGFYENAFRLMRDVYDEWRKPPGAPFQSWRDAFRPEWQISLQETRGDGTWSTWNLTLPPLPGEPGDGLPLADEWTLLKGLLSWLDERAKEPLAPKHDPSPARHVLSAEIEAIVVRARVALEGYGAPLQTLTHRLLDAAHTMVQWLAAAEHVRSLDTRRALLACLSHLRASLTRGASHDRAEAEGWGRYWRLFQLACAIGVGIANDVLPPWGNGFDGINDYDLKDWLMWHGAPPEVAWSAPTIALYDLGFAYVGGVANKDNGRAAAGAALRVLLNLGLGYKKAPLWKMQAGMGDTVFAPLYEVLALQRGVRFEFFRRVLSIGASPDGNLVERIRISRQANTKEAAYAPLVDVKGLPCWPSEPRWEKLENGEEMGQHADEFDFESAWCQKTVGEELLELGRDFDAVILGISVAALPQVAADLIEQSPRWQSMVAWTKTVQTQSLQLWLEPDLAGLGWTAGTTVMTGYAEPFDSWGEMSHLIVREDWRGGDAGSPRALEYFCGVLDDAQPIPPFTDGEFPRREHQRVRANAVDWLGRHVGHLWPRATAPDRPGALDWSKLVDPKNRAGEARLDAQFWRANIDPTERYVLSVPGSIDKRLSPGESGFANLQLAGDWTKTSLNCGCAEAAIESGLLAARALVARAGA